MSEQRKYKVLMVATSRDTKGGINTVLEAWNSLSIWEGSMGWLALQSNNGIASKLYYLITGYVKALFCVPKFDIIHFHGCPGICMMLQLPVFFLALIFHKKIVYHLHIGNQIADHVGDSLFDFYLRKSDKVVVLADVFRDELRPMHVDMGKIATLYNPAPPVSSICQKKKVILFLAYLVENKGYEHVLRAFADVSPRYPEWELVMAGAGEVQKARILAHSLGIESHVRVLDWVVGVEKEQLLSDASVYCMASYQEGFPMTVLEAFSHGLAVVTTPVGGLVDFVKDGENAMVFDFGDEEGLSKILTQLFDDDLLMRKIADNGTKLARNLFSIEHTQASICEIYDSI